MHNPVVFNGTWEQENKNPLLAALILVFIWGGLYFAVSSTLVSVYIVVDMVAGRPDFLQGKLDFVELYKSYYTRYQYPVLISTTLFQFLFFLFLPMRMIGRWHTRQITAYARYNAFRFPLFLVSLLGIVVVLPLVDALSRFLYSFFPVLEKFSDMSAPLYTYRNPADFVLVTLSICVTPAVCEEFLFRGYLQRTLERKMRFPWHFLLSGLLFSLFHQQTLNLPALFIIGCYLGYIYYAGRSLYITMTAHFVYNFLILLVFNAKPALPWLLDGKGNFTYAAAGISLVLFAGCWLLLEKLRLHGEQQEAPAEAAQP